MSSGQRLRLVALPAAALFVCVPILDPRRSRVPYSFVSLPCSRSFARVPCAHNFFLAFAFALLLCQCSRSPPQRFGPGLLLTPATPVVLGVGVVLVVVAGAGVGAVTIATVTVVVVVVLVVA
mgnify:CR=1 FL=1